MDKTFNAKIKLEVSVAPCKAVWFEKNEEPLSIKAKALYEALNPQGEGLDYREAYYLQWENEKKKQKVDIERATAEMVNIIGSRKSLDIIRLIYFWQEVGPLFSGNIISVNEASAKIMFASLLIGAKYSTEKEKPGMPPRIGPIQLGIIDVLKKKSLEQPDIKKWTWFFLGTDIMPEIIPAKKGDWPIFIVPNKWPADREEIVEYVKEEVRRNALELLEIISLEWSKKGDIIIRPASLYDAIIAWHCLESPKIIGKKEISTRVKQSVLNRFRNYRYRKHEPLSEKDFERVKHEINRAWEKGVRDKGELEKVGFNVMEKIARLKKAKS